jgi:hypothetical protein
MEIQPVRQQEADAFWADKIAEIMRFIFTMLFSFEN